MTRKQHRIWKKKNLQARKEEIDDRPLWADDEKQEVEDKNWLVKFKEDVLLAIAIRDQQGI